MTWTRFRWLALLALAACSARAAPPVVARRPALPGFTAAGAAGQRAREAAFQRGLSPGRIGAFHAELTAEPHPAASPRNDHLAELIAAEWRAAGWEDVQLRRYRALHSLPIQVSLEMIAPVRARASLREDPIDADPATRDPRVSPAFAAFSASGDVTAEVVYAGPGNPEDYEHLAARGIAVRGKIVLVRYARPYSFRGFKVKTAERAGAAAVLIYSDPADDGFARGPVFPDGPFGPDSHVQRGLVSDAPSAPGDPTTPGWASTESRRLPVGEAWVLPHIPVLPLSWRDALPLLRHMTGPEAPAAWRGALPITYRMTGAVTARVRVQMDNQLRTYTDVTARIRGANGPGEWLLLGNHRDAWVYGAADPSSGTAAMMELARGLGRLRKDGWRPARTIAIASWDGEEYGMIGSTEYAEELSEAARSKLVAYLNVDTAIFGARNLLTGQVAPHFLVEAVPSLAGLIVEVSRTVRVPGGETLFEAWGKTRAQELGSPAPIADLRLVTTEIDSSTDHAAFLAHLGRPVASFTYAGQYGVYHSMYDDALYFRRFGDPGFGYSRVVAEVWGLIALRLADADVLPFDPAHMARTLRAYVAALPPGDLDLRELRGEIDRLEAAAGRFDAEVASALARLPPGHPRLANLSSRRLAAEGTWLHAAGLPGRPWFKHLVYATRPTFLPLVLPGITEAAERGDRAEAARQIQLLAAAVRRSREELE